MDYKMIGEADRKALVLLHSNYKIEIGEDAPTKEAIGFSIPLGNLLAYEV
jgi:hypothetical protein